MKHILKLSLITALILHVLEPAGEAKGKSQFSVGLRQHVDHSDFDEYPFDNDTLSYGAAYEYHDKSAFWQLAVLYTEDVDTVTSASGPIPSTSEVDYILTPQLNLIFNEEYWRAGAGILGNYVVTDDDKDWADPYWQFMLGIGFPVMAFKADFYAYYVYEDWGSLGDVDFDDIEFGGWLGFAF